MQAILKGYPKAITNNSFFKSGDSVIKRFNSALLALFFVALQVFTPFSAAVHAAPLSDEPADATPGIAAAAADPVPATNPPLGQSCGLDIALVLDNSTSISSGELTNMKNAMTAFTAAFAGTPTQFSVTHFASNATVDQAFTGNTGAVNSAINSIPVGGGFTNWEDGLAKATGTFDPRPTVPNLVIFASDGNPNRVGNGASATESEAVNAAILKANALKGSPLNTHITALGIGNDLDVSNLQAISGPGDVVTSNFADLAADLAKLANNLCGGTITTTKLIDQDGKLNTTNDRVPAAGWQFDINGSPSNPAANSTDVNGQTPAVKVDAGTYSVNETQQSGYQLLSASCTGASANGSTQGNSVTNIVVGSSNIVTCTFINSPTPTLKLVKTVVNNNGGSKTAADFQGKIDGNNVAWSTAVPLSVGAHTASEVSLPGYAASVWGGDCAANGKITLSLGQNATCTITNDDIAPSLTYTKIVNNPFGTPKPVSSFPLYVDGIQVTSGVATSQFDAGAHILTETGSFGYQMSGVSGDCNLKQDTISILLNLGSSATCTITNTAIQPKLIVKKHVVNDNSGTKSASDFTMTVSGNSQAVSNFAGSESGTEVLLNEGSYSVDELVDTDYTKNLSGDCSGTISVGEVKTCTVTNNDKIHPAIKVVKSGPATAHEGDTVTYYFNVTNTGDTPLAGLDVQDDIAGLGAYLYGDNGNDILDVGETWVYSADYEVPTSQTADVVNTVTACAHQVNSNVELYCDTDTHTLDVLHPSINVVKTGPATAKAGSTVTYTFTVTNTGDEPLVNLDVVDSLTGNGVYVSGDTNGNDALDVDETWIYTGEYEIPSNQTADVTNTVVACGNEYKQEVPEIDIRRMADAFDFNVAAQVNLPPSACSEDNHTLTIEKAAVVVTPQSATLAPSGVSRGFLLMTALINIVLSLTALGYLRYRYGTTS